MKALFLIGFVALACTPRPLDPVAPETPDADAAVVDEPDAARRYTCASGCRNGAALGCAWGTSPACEDACNVRISSGVSKLSVKCLSELKTCDTAECTR